VTGWIEALAAAEASGTPAVLVTVLRVAGSTPREAGAKMVVTADEARGSVGGGNLEWKALELARALLAAADEPQPVVREFALGPSLGQCCGGTASLLFEPIVPARWHIAVFGAGHVGKALVKVLADVPCRVTWIDARHAEFPDELAPSVARVLADSPDEAVADLAPGGDVVVLTHDHQLDLRIVEAVLRRGDQRYLGVIGSGTKRAKFRARLAQRGLAPEVVDRMTCPMGVDGIRGKHPAVIAIAIAAQLLQLRKVTH
jgi:xanthine dehydrogenase accessory factor